MAADDRTVKLRLGFPGHEKIVEAKVPADEPVPWHLDDTLRTAGRPHSRVDAVLKVTGRAKFASDIRPKGLLHGKFLRCPHAHAKVRSIDASAAETLPGVRAVEIFPGKEVRYAWDFVAVVAADTEDIVRDALERIRVEYDVLPFVVGTEAAMAAGAPPVFQDRPDNVREMSRDRSDGDDTERQVEEALRGAARTVEAVCRTQVQTHTCLETHGAVASFEGDTLTVWASTQATFGVRGDLAEIFGIPASSVRVITEHMGGGFGSKFGADAAIAWAARLSKKTGRPVKLMLDRREEHTSTGNRPDSVQKMRLAVGEDGKLGAYRIRTLGTGGIAGNGAGARNPMIYRFGKVDKREFAVLTNAGPLAAMRAPGHPQGSFALETIIDMAAEAAGLDPLEFRRRNDDHPIRSVQYGIGAERIGWDRRAATPARGPVRRGLGMAATRWGNPGGPPAEVIVRISRDGSVEVRNGCQDIGTGTRTVMGLVVAEELGLPLPAVKVFLGDTRDPVGPGSGGSMTIGSVTPAARQGAWLARRELLALAAEALGVPAETLDLRDGRVVSTADPAKVMSFAEACRLIRTDVISATGRRRRDRYPGFSGENGGVQFVEVEVDTDLGQVRVVKVVAVHDAGRIIDPLTAESQVFGGVIQGISYALHEQRILDRQTGRMVNADMEFYKIAGSLDVPEIDCVLTDVANGINSTGVLGLGEPTVIPTAAAVANAVCNAIGARVFELPITPDRVLLALANKESGR